MSQRARDLSVCYIHCLSLMVKVQGLTLVSSTETQQKSRNEDPTGCQQSVRHSLFRSRLGTDMTLVLMGLTTLYGREVTAMYTRLTTQPFQKPRGMGN